MSFVGLLTSLLALAGIADLGMGSLMALHIASVGGSGHLDESASRKARGLLTRIVALAVGVFIAGAATAQPIGHWLLPSCEQTGINPVLLGTLSAACVGARIVESAARGGVIAAGHQSLAAVTNLVLVMLRVVGASVALRMPGAGLSSFLWWILATQVLASGLAAWQCWQATRPNGSQAVPDVPSPHGSGFALGVFLTAAFSSFAAQSDRLQMQGRISELDMTAYCLAAQLMAIRGLVAGPLFQSFFPRLAMARRCGNHEESRFLVSRLTAWMCVAVIPPLILAIVVPYECLYAYTGSPRVASAGANSMRLLGIAALLNTASFPSFAVERASGRWRAGLLHALAGLALAWVGLHILTPRIGVLAGGVSQCGYYLLYLLCFSRSAAGAGASMKWLSLLARGAGPPSLLAAAAGGVTMLVLTPDSSRVATLLTLAGGLAFSWMAAAAAELIARSASPCP